MEEGLVKSQSFPAHQPSFSDEEFETPHPRARFGGKAPSAKRPWRDEPPEEDEMDDGSDDQPDLADYFSQWDIPPKDQILMCRAYASYLSAQNKPHARK